MDMVHRLGEALRADVLSISEDGSHQRLTLPGSPAPLVLDVLAAPGATPQRVAVLLPGGGLNVRANFCTAEGRSLARFLVDHHYLVVGITPREDMLPEGAADQQIAGWGLAAHRKDVSDVLAAVDEAVGLPCDLLGHSAGAALALDTAAQRGASPQRVLVLDTTGPYNPSSAPDLVARADALADTFQGLLDRGVGAVDPGLKRLFAAATIDPTGSSGVPRPTADAGRFTNLALLHYALIRTRDLPGPANWIYRRGHSSGTYSFADDPGRDSFTLDRSTLAVWTRAIAGLGSGLQPTALLRDLAAIWAGREEVYRIDWAAIRAEVVWLNAEHGRGDHDLGARLIRAGGARVDYRVIPGYGHADLLWAARAEHEVWPHLLPQ